MIERNTVSLKSFFHLLAGGAVAMLVAELCFFALLFVPFITLDPLSWLLPLLTVAFFCMIFLLPRMLVRGHRRKLQNYHSYSYRNHYSYAYRRTKDNLSCYVTAVWYFIVALLIAYFAPERYPYFEWTLTLPLRGVILLEGFLGGLIALSGLFAAWRFLVPLSCILCSVVNVAVCVWLFSPGSWSGLRPDGAWGVSPSGAERTEVKEIPSPYGVERLYYGSGNDSRRVCYRDSVAVITPTVDARTFDLSAGQIDDIARKLYWDFDASQYPLNGVLFLPTDTIVKAPLVMIVHGNHYMQEYSEIGYEYLGDYLARRGYAVALIDENFINRNWSGDFDGREKTLRAWLVLKHLEEISSWTNGIGRRIDTDRIALIGHSRGGEAVALASVMNGNADFSNDSVGTIAIKKRFPIKSVIQLAPTADYKYNGKGYTVENVDYLLILAGRDTDVFTLEGQTVYDNVKFTDGVPHFKSLQYLYSVTHSGFNSAWTADRMIPYRLLLEQKDLMSPKAQQYITSLYVSHFLNASFEGDLLSRKAIADNRLLNSMLPLDYRQSSFRDSRFVGIGGAGVDSLTVEWPERDSVYRIDCPALSDTTIRAKGCLSFDVTNLSPGKCDFTIAFIAADGSEKTVALSDFYALPPRLDLKLNKIEKVRIVWPKLPYHLVGQTVCVPIPENLNGPPVAVEFRFDLTPSGKAMIRDVGISPF